VAKKKDQESAFRRRALYPGSFDPLTRGHLDVVASASRLFDRVYVGVIENPSKSPLFSVEERVRLIAAEAEAFPNVEVVSFKGLTVELAAKLDAPWIVRGIRSEADASSELSMARSNRLCGARPIETVFLPASPEVSFISSSLVREIAARGGKLSAFVTRGVEDALRRKLGSSGQVRVSRVARKKDRRPFPRPL
jgi:pantetheine-phosphate adenylyltransferase